MHHWIGMAAEEGRGGGGGVRRQMPFVLNVFLLKLEPPYNVHRIKWEDSLLSVDMVANKLLYFIIVCITND